jgi:hypothetical protein
MEMQTIAETRLVRLTMLTKRFNDSLADLNEAIGLVRTDSTLSQIRNQSAHSKTGAPRVMGDVLARRIEAELALERGWMDTPPTYAELTGETDPRALVLLAMEKMPDSEIYQLLRLADAVKKPAEPAPPAAARNGTTG